MLPLVQEPGSIDSEGNPTATALPDMIVFVYDYEGDGLEFRTNIETFR
jgi:hypothetical protein